MKILILMLVLGIGLGCSPIAVAPPSLPTPEADITIAPILTEAEAVGVVYGNKFRTREYNSCFQKYGPTGEKKEVYGELVDVEEWSDTARSARYSDGVWVVTVGPCVLIVDDRTGMVTSR